MNKAELQAILAIAKKLGWNGMPASLAINIINQMVKNQQSFELDTVGDCGGYEETLLTIASYPPMQLMRTTFVDSYESFRMLSDRCPYMCL